MKTDHSCTENQSRGVGKDTRRKDHPSLDSQQPNVQPATQNGKDQSLCGDQFRFVQADKKTRAPDPAESQSWRGSRKRKRSQGPNESQQVGASRKNEPISEVKTTCELAQKNGRDHGQVESQAYRVPADSDRRSFSGDTVKSTINVRTALIGQLIDKSELYRQFIQANTRLTNQIKALGRRGKWETHLIEFEPLQAASDAFELQKQSYGKVLAGIAKQLSTFEWVETVRGFGAVNFALIVGAAGDLSDYANPQKLRKRMGLMAGQRKTKNKEEAKRFGYNPARRAIMHIVGECLLKLNQGKYREIYDRRKQFEIEKAVASGLEVVPALEIDAKMKKTGKPREAFMSDGHVHKRSMRVMEQKLLDDLWGEWTRRNGISERAREIARDHHCCESHLRGVPEIEPA